MSKVYFIGIKGVGMTALACCYQDSGWDVAGSDTGEVFITDAVLNERQIKISPLDVPVPTSSNLVIYSTAYAAPQVSCRAIPLAVAVAEFVASKKLIAVSGVGGKTTTSAMLAALFHQVGRDVGYYVGTGSIAGLAAPGHAGSDPYFVVEADEYAVSKSDNRAKMNLLTPDILVTTNIVHDHPDIYRDEQATDKAFAELVSRIRPGGSWICNPEDPGTARLLDLQACLPDRQGLSLKGIKVIHYTATMPQLDLAVFGLQNQLDARAAVLAAVESGVSKSQAVAGIKAYRGAGRRQEFFGQVADRLLYDDYGHHPSEIKVTINSFREHFPGRRIILVFESHTYSRTEALLAEFGAAVASADLTFIMPIFESAREKNTPHTALVELLAKEAGKYNPSVKVVTWQNAPEQVVSASLPGDVILTMGAGMVYKLHPEIAKYLTRI